MNPSIATQNGLSLAGRSLIALLFVPAGLSKIGSFAGVAGYIASKGVPVAEVCAAIAIAVEVGLGLLILAGWQTRWAALGIGIAWFLSLVRVLRALILVGGLAALIAWIARGRTVAR
jgi:uncharacterized membrane protein YphA (DoxX/SURF4 family)